MGLLGFILFGILCSPCTWISFFILKLGKLLATISLNTFSAPCFLSYSSRDPHNVNVDMLDIIPKTSSTVFFFFLLFAIWLALMEELDEMIRSHVFLQDVLVEVRLKKEGLGQVWSRASLLLCSVPYGGQCRVPRHSRRSPEAGSELAHFSLSVCSSTP